MNKTFQILSEEAQFTSKILGIGLTQLGKANFTQKGLYFSSFTGISTGLERIGKLCLILHYYIKNQGEFPDERYLKYDIGHDLEKLYEKSKDILNDYDIKFYFSNKVDSPLHSKILAILSDFAKGDRYSNINYIVNSRFQSDPIQKWYKDVDIQLFEEKVSQRKKDKIRNDAKIGSQLNSIVQVIYLSESRDSIDDIESLIHSSEMHKAISKYRQLYVLQLIRYWVEILIILQNESLKINSQEIPHFKEIFMPFYLADKHCLTIKTYDK